MERVGNGNSQQLDLYRLFGSMKKRKKTLNQRLSYLLPLTSNVDGADI